MIKIETSTRSCGDLRRNPDKFLKTLKLNKKLLITAEQVHGNKIKVVSSSDIGKTIAGVDGLMTQTIGIILGIHTADCLPILFYDAKSKAIGACHAGWKGVLTKLPQKMIDLMILKGASPERIEISIGPHICPKCYEIKKDLAERFEGDFGQLLGMITAKNGKIYLDLAIPAVFQLVNSGVPEENINLSQECTGCDNNKYFSYRKDNKRSYGEMLSVISLIK